MSDKQKADLKVDSLTKVYYMNPNHFSDMVNGTVFDGRQVIHAHMISDYDTNTSTYYDENAETKTIDRERDVIKKVTMGECEILIGIENQGQEKWNMPFRILEYNTFTQSRQWKQITNHDQLLKNPPIRSMSIVLYYGEKGWKGVRTYDEATQNVPVEFETLSSYNMFPIVDMVNLDYQKFKNKDNRDLVKGLQMLYCWNGDVSVFKGMKMSKIVALIISAHSNNRELLDIIEQENKEEIDMCESVRRFKEKAIQEGKEKGMRDILKAQLNQKLGELSSEMISRINQSTKEQLDRLVVKIFDIEKEEDIIKVLLHS